MISMCSASWNDSTHIMGQWSEYDEIVHLGGKEMECEHESEREEKRERRVEQEVSEVTRGREGKEKYSQRCYGKHRYMYVMYSTCSYNASRFSGHKGDIISTCSYWSRTCTRTDITLNEKREEAARKKLMVSLSDLGDLGFEVLPLVQRVPPDVILLLYWSAICSWTTGSGGRREEERGGRGKEGGGGKERMREMGKLGGREGKGLRDGREEEEREK